MFIKDFIIEEIIGIHKHEKIKKQKIKFNIVLEVNQNSVPDENNIKTIIWATGFRPDLSWLDVPVLDRKGQILHEGGIVNFPGMYLMGMQFLRRRKSSLIDGAGDDALDLSRHLKAYLDG